MSHYPPAYSTLCPPDANVEADARWADILNQWPLWVVAEWWKAWGRVEHAQFGDPPRRKRWVEERPPGHDPRLFWPEAQFWGYDDLMLWAVLCQFMDKGCTGYAGVMLRRGSGYMVV